MTVLSPRSTSGRPDAPLLTAALQALARGWNVLPVHARKGPHRVLIETGHWHLNDEGERVPSWKALQSERVTEDLLRVWFDPRARVSGLAAVTGEISGLVVLDFDGEAGRALHARLGLPVSALSGSGAPHVYFGHPGWRVRTVSSAGLKHPPFPGLDVRADGGMIVLPPSELLNGRYRMVSGRLLGPDELDEAVALWSGLSRPPAPPLPELDETAIQGGADAQQLLQEALSRMPAGRNNAGYWLARELRAAGYPEAEALNVMLKYADHTPLSDSRGRRDPYTAQHARASLRSAYAGTVRRKGAREASGAPEDPLVTARRVLPTLGADERAELTRLIAGAYAREDVEAARRALRELGLRPEAAVEARRKLDAGVSVSGMPRLSSFLRERSARLGRAT